VIWIIIRSYWLERDNSLDVSLGSLPDMAGGKIHVRFTPDSDIDEGGWQERL
jgi:hypothetical protein